MAGYYSNAYPAYTPPLPWHAARIHNNYTFGTIHNHHNCDICGTYLAHVLNEPRPQLQYPSISPSLAATNVFPAAQQGDFEHQHGFQEGFNAGGRTLSCADSNEEDRLKEEEKKERDCGTKVQSELLEKAQAEIDHLRNQLVAQEDAYDELIQRVALAATQKPGGIVSALPAPDPRPTALLEAGGYAVMLSSDDDSTTEDSDSNESFHYVGHSRMMDNNTNDSDQNTDGGLKEEAEREASNESTLMIGNQLTQASDEVFPSTSGSRPITPRLDKEEDSPSPPSSPPRPQPEALASSVGEVRELMDRAHRNGEEALAQVKLLVSQAHATPPAVRTEVHTVLLTEWRRPQGQTSSSLFDINIPSLVPLPPLEHVYVDASDVGVGFIFNKQWEAWRLRNGWRQGGWKQGKIRDIQWAEAVAVELGVRVMIKAGYVGREITICSDNMQVVQAFSEGRYIGEPLAQEVLDNTERLCRQLKIRLKVLWIRGTKNPADQISRLNVGDAADRFPCHAEIPPFLQDVVVPFYQ